MIDQWFPLEVTDPNVPEDGTVVVVLRSDGSSAKMKYYKGLWFIGPDYAVYTYFTPVFWRYRGVGE